jgi:hypothetical protein
MAFVKYPHLIVLPANLLNSRHILPHFTASSKTVLFQVYIGLPLLLAPCGFQSNACFDVTSYVSFLWGSNTQERDVTAGP